MNVKILDQVKYGMNVKALDQVKCDRNIKIISIAMSQIMRSGLYCHKEIGPE
jgi:hypothetical protein